MQTQLEITFQKMEEKAKQDGVEVELSASISDSFSASYSQGKLNKYNSSQGHSATVRVIDGKSPGVSTTEDLSAEGLLAAYNEAKQTAKDLKASVDPTKVGYDELQPPGKYTAMPELFSDAFSKVSIDQKLAWAKELEDAALKFDGKISVVPYSGYGEGISTRFLFNSKGQRLTYQASGANVYSYAIGKDGAVAVNGYDAHFVRSPDAFSPKQIAQTAAKKALDMLSYKKLKSGNYTVIFENEVFSELASAFSDHFSAKSVAEETSLLKGKRGKKIFSEKITLIDDPLNTKLQGARPFDSEGTPSKQTTLVENGTLKTYLTNGRLAKEMMLPNTGNAVLGTGEMEVGFSNLTIQKGTKSFEELIASAPEVFVIVEVDALHAGYKDTSADFSLPARGFYYRNGKKEFAVNDVVVSGNMLDILTRAKDISNRWPEAGGANQYPDLLIEGISIAGE